MDPRFIDRLPSSLSRKDTSMQNNIKMGLVKVPPGNATGIFYILVCSLPWNCSGQRLKDFARNQQPDGSCIEIDHAHVYEDGTTSGWVRVKGKENFDQAMGTFLSYLKSAH